MNLNEKQIRAKVYTMEKLRGHVLKAMEEIKDKIHGGYIMGELRNGSVMEIPGNHTLADLCAINPKNMLFQINDFEVVDDELYIAITPINPVMKREHFKEDGTSDRWLFLPRAVGSVKNNIYKIITIDARLMVEKIDENGNIIDPIVKEEDESADQ